MRRSGPDMFQHCPLGSFVPQEIYMISPWDRDHEPQLAGGAKIDEPLRRRMIEPEDIGPPGLHGVQIPGGGRRLWKSTIQPSWTERAVGGPVEKAFFAVRLEKLSCSPDPGKGSGGSSASIGNVRGGGQAGRHQGSLVGENR